MIFTELRFLGFLAIVWSVHWALRGNGARKAWLLAASCVFYGAWDVRFLGLMLATIVVDWAVALGMERTPDGRGRRALLVLSLVSNLGVLGFFKYWDFFVDSTVALLSGIGFDAHVPTLRVVLPVGISFYTFQSLSYTIDVYRRDLPACRSLPDFALFVAFFPQLVAGPIVRAADFLPQLARKTSFASADWRRCAALFLVGYVKKSVVADHLAVPVDAVFASTGTHGAADVWLATALWSAQLYCDFSGYSDMAIALAGAFGYSLTRNFDFPYLARTVTEFRLRWHVSLTSWFRDYLYVPLGGNRVGRVRNFVNLFFVFLLAGLWHGAAWTYASWGLLYGVTLLVERVWMRDALARLPRIAGHVWTLTIVGFGSVIFRAPTFGAAADGFAAMFGASSAPSSLSPVWWVLLAALLAMHAAMARGVVVRTVDRMPWWAFATAAGALAALALPWVSAGYVPFVYFQF